MSNEYKLVNEAGEKSKVVSFRVGEKVYQALEKLASAQGGTISASARNLVLSSLDTDSMEFVPGDTVVNSEGVLVVLVDKETTSGADISSALINMSGKKKTNRK